MMSAMCVNLHQLSVVSKHVSLCRYTRRAAPAGATWTRILKSLMKIPIEISNKSLTTILERSIALCLPNSGPDKIQTKWMKLRPIRSFMKIRIFDSVSLKILFFPFIDPLRGIEIAKRFRCRRRASIITFLRILLYGRTPRSVLLEYYSCTAV